MPINFQHKPGLVAYITCGDPDLATSREVVLAAIAAGADVLELGVPFSDPVADGPVIQAASDRALKNNVSLGDVLKLAADVRKQAPEAGLIVFSYFNPILRYGLERFCEDAAGAGLDGALVTDLPVEEAGEYIELMRSHDLATVFLAAPTSTNERLKAVCEASTGFLYAVSRTGVTGVRQRLATDAGALVQRLRQFTTLPIAVGFGVSDSQQFAEIGSFADAAVVGTAIVQRVERGGRTGAASAVSEFIRGLRAGTSAAVKA